MSASDVGLARFGDVSATFAARTGYFLGTEKEAKQQMKQG